MRPLHPHVAEPAAGLPRAPLSAVRRFFTRPGERPLDLVGWERRIVVGAEEAEAAARHRQVEVPEHWSRDAALAFARHLLHDPVASEPPEWSVRQLLRRAVVTLALWGREGGHLPNDEATEAFEAELAYLLVHQMAALNLPAWTALGVEPEPLCCGCPIASVGRAMTTALDLAGSGELLLSQGSGAGVNLSTLPSASEHGGFGPVSFLGDVEALTAAFRSAAGAAPPARSAALNVDHPDIRAFVTTPSAVDGGDPGGDLTGRVVRVSDTFMQAVAADGWWETHAVATGAVVARERARNLLELIVTHALASGQPRVHFDDTINRWNTCAGWGKITAASPCGEHMFLDDTASQLACLNLLPFLDSGGLVCTEALRQAAEVVVLALEIILSHSRYPGARIAARTRELRPLGLGYANLGAFLLALGLPYDSDRGRTTAAAVTSLITGSAYAQSARIAAALGSFSGYPANRLAMLEVLDRHREAAHRLPRHLPAELRAPAVEVWDEAITLGTRFGFRNAQVTTIAPTGTVARLMDCASAGLQPVSLGRDHEPTNELLARGLDRLGLPPSAARLALDELRSGVTPDRWTQLQPGHRVLFAPPSALARLRMATAVQPFLSGAATAELAVPAATTPSEAQVLVVQAWKLGAKAVGLRRVGGPSVDEVLLAGRAACQRRRTHSRRRPLPDQHLLLTHRFATSGHEGQLSVALYPEGTPAEVTITVVRPSPSLADAVGAIAGAITTGLQHGVPLDTVLSGLDRLRERHSEWVEPAQATATAEVVDHVVNWMTDQFLRPSARGVAPASGDVSPADAGVSRLDPVRPSPVFH